MGLMLAATFAACDTAPGPEASGRGPVVSDLQYDPPAIVVSSLPEGSVSGGRVTVPMTISVRAGDPDGDLAEVAWLLRGPDAGSDPVAEGLLAVQTGGRYSATVSVSLPLAVTGRYTLIVFASDRAGRLGNEARGAVDLLAEGRPPTITAVEMPERVVRPAPGAPPVVVRIVATVEDPDGLANVLRVQTRVNDRTTLLLCDDGSAGACNGSTASGDAVAVDGRFTLTIQVESTNSAGSNTFVFTATDRSGLTSVGVTKVIVIE
jgi:hypothetical protein